MAIKGATGIVADDLTGANDTALQFFIKGSNTEIIFETENCENFHSTVHTWALTTETRNIDVKNAAEIVWQNARRMKESFSIENFYKKIDSTLRGNVAVETLAMLEAIEYDAAVIAPAFIQEGRITIGGYQLLKGVPIERTDAARDTYAPIYDSYIPDILKKQVNENLYDTIDVINFSTVVKGALSISTELNKKIECGRKLIVLDAVSSVDLEQIALAIEKCKYKVLPVGSAGLANALSSIWLPAKDKETTVKQFPVLPKLILSGSKTSITKAQLNCLIQDDNIENLYIIELSLNDILDKNLDIVKRIVQNMGKDNIAIVHVCGLDKETESDEGKKRLIDEGISREKLAEKITDYLAEIAKETEKVSDFILITLGGETSYKCARAIECGYLQVTDSILPAIPLCMNANAKFIVTKSGNMGSVSTLVDIINYFKSHEKE